MDVRATVVTSKPPFRAEHIGSLLRPAALLRERARFSRGEIGRAELSLAEDDAIRDVIRLQEELGFKFVTDGEFRRRSYHSYFYRQLGDSASIRSAAPTPAVRTGRRRRGAQPDGPGPRPRAVDASDQCGDVAFLRANSRSLPKITIPGPCALHFRGGDAAVTATAYKDTDLFWSDIVAAFTRELRRSPMPAAVTCRSTRRHSPNSAIPTCRPCSQRAATTGAR